MVRNGNAERMPGGAAPSREIEDYASYEGEHCQHQMVSMAHFNKGDYNFV